MACHRLRFGVELSGQVPHCERMDASDLAGDAVRRFAVEERPVRGHFVRMEEAWRVLREHRDHLPPVRELLGEVVTASVLLAATLKFRGTLTLQLQGGSGAVRLLLSQCTHDFRVRATVRVDEARLAVGSTGEAGRSAPPSESAAPAIPAAPESEAARDRSGALTPDVFQRLVGAGGRLIVTVEADEREARYQGIVPLEGGSFAESLEEYFASSEQLPTRVRLAADETHAAGLLIQRMPGRRDATEEEQARAAWADAERGIGGLGRRELLGAPLERVLTRSFARRDLRLYGGSPVRFECRCGPERVAGLLRALGAEEVRDVLAEQGAVTVTCDFCNREYRFDALGVAELFAGESHGDAPRSLH